MLALSLAVGLAHGHRVADFAPLRVGLAPRCASAVACAAGTSAAGAIAGFWDEVVLAQQSRSSRTSTLLVKGCEDDALLLEYLNSCSELFGSDTCSITAAASAAGSSAISVHVEPNADAAADAALAATEASGSRPATHSRDSALELMMDWFTAQLMACEIADIGPGDEEDAIADDAAFVALGRSLLHTKSSLVSFAPTVQEMHRDIWRMVADADYLQDGSGGAALFVAPSFSNYEVFDDFSLLARSGLRYLVSPSIDVRVYHPLAPADRNRSPMPTVHIYLDNEDLLADGGGTLTSLLQNM